MDIEFISNIITAGAMGVSVISIFIVYSLLKKEQEQEQPRSDMLTTIHVFMAFLIIMTIVALGIEITRFALSSGEDSLASQYKDKYQADSTALIKEIEDICTQNLYAINANGYSEGVPFEFKDTTYLIGKQLPKDLFKKQKLYLEKQSEDKWSVVKKNNGQSITWGYIAAKDLSTGASPPQGATLTDELFGVGISHMPDSLVRMAKVDLRQWKNYWEANKYLIRLINGPLDDRKLISDGIKLLIQRPALNRLDSTQVQKLVSAYSRDGIRPHPWNKYELAQVYLQLYWNTEKPHYRNKYREYLGKYIKGYETMRQDTNSTEYKWYLSAKESLGQ